MASGMHHHVGRTIPATHDDLIIFIAVKTHERFVSLCAE
jgi:hypothetical protein